MLICNSCLKQGYLNEESIAKSYGRCECCKDKMPCNDISSKDLIPKPKKYTVTIKVVDNTTGKDADITLQSDDPKSFNKIGNLIEASCTIMNYNPEELADFQKMTQELINKHHN